MPSKLVKILLALVLIKSLLWLVLVPIFQIPDEPSHFAIVEYLSEHGRRPHPRRERATPTEVMQAAEAVNFDWQISHPVWRGYTPDWREQLSLLPLESRQTFVDNFFQTSLKRPPLYYYLAAPFYFLGGSSFLGRFFAVRFLSVIFHLATVWLAYATARKVFRSWRLGLAVGSLVGFQPMLSFLSVGVHYDPLAILTVTVFIYFVAHSRNYLSWVAALIGIMVKPDLIFLPLVRLKFRWLLAAGIALLLSLAALARPLEMLIARQQTGGWDRLLYLANINEYSSLARFFWENLISGQIFWQFINYFVSTAALHWAQVFPWYWGTFGWLEVSLPAWIYAGLKLIIFISFAGWIKVWHKKSHRGWGWLWLLVIVQALIVWGNDFKVFITSGEIFGIQGRYFFPAIVAQMLLLVFGLSQWLPEKLLTKAIIGLSVGLNLAGLVTAYRYFGWVWGS